MRVFYWREKIRKSEYFSQFLGAHETPRGFLARENFGNKKAGKTAARKKKTYGWGFYLRHFACMSCLSLALFMCMLDILLKKFCISLSLSVSYGVFTYEIFSLSVIFWFFLTILSV